MMLERTEMVCSSCGVQFALTAQLYAARRRDGATFFCPNGHRLSYTGEIAGEIEQLKKRVERLTSERDSALASRNNWRASAEKLVYRCVMAGCDELRLTKASLRKHLETVHGFGERLARALPENAGPSSH